MLLLAALCSATDEQYQHDYGKSSSGGHDADNNRTVVLNRASEQYLAMIFQDYSDNSSGRISAPRFKDLLQDLSLGEPVILEKSTKKHSKDSVERDHRHTRSYNGPPGKLAREFAGQQRRQNRRSVGEFKDAPNSRYFVSHENRANSRDRKRRDEHSDSHNDNEQCLEERDLLRIHQVSETEGVSKEDFVRICPSLIHQLQEGACIEVKQPSSGEEEPADQKMLHVWGYGVLSITVISLTSLLAIAIIPLIGRSVYKKIMSFLVALAIGTLSGDALLHLIPHAFSSSHGNEDKDDGGEQHKINVYKSCVIMAGIYLFFMVECMMKARLGRKQSTEEQLHVCDDVTSPDEMTLRQRKKYAEKYQEMIGSRLAGIQRCISCDGEHFPKVSSPFSMSCKPSSCELVIVESGKEERASNTSESSQEKVPLWDASCRGHHCHQRYSLSERSKHSFSDTELVAAVQGKSRIHPNIYTNENFTASASDNDSQTNNNVNQIQCHQGNQYKYPVPSETTTMKTENLSDGTEQSYEEEHNHDHQHHHHHSHTINKNTSIATVAWMVIVGDGFHNFSDGLAVGAAFSFSLTSGLTTAIAVFCHELPHELGDFAILLKSGLTFRQAVTYNFASAIISYIGLVLGIIVGDIQSAHSWVLALTAGMFLYISLVDMLPELSSYIQEGGGWSAVISQNMGILTGVAIMLVVALYER